MKMNDFIYLYDGSFIDLMNVMEYLFHNKIKPVDIQNENTYQRNLMDETFHPTLENESKFIEKIMNEIGRQVLHTIYYVYLSVSKHKELIIYYFLLNGFKYGAKVRHLRNLKCVNEALNIEQYVGRENHKMKGFLRFRELKNHVLFAEIAPENNILSILSKHFKERLKGENWIIKDVKRDIVSVYNKKEFFIVNGTYFQLFHNDLHESELEFVRLWKLFFKTIAIEPRENLKCQRNFMPKKYWNYIIEMSDQTNEKNNKWN